jgi:hypothetical protein
VGVVAKEAGRHDTELLAAAGAFGIPPNSCDLEGYAAE